MNNYFIFCLMRVSDHHFDFVRLPVCLNLGNRRTEISTMKIWLSSQYHQFSSAMGYLILLVHCETMRYVTVPGVW